MPLQSPVHSRTAAACESMRWKNWSGFHAVCHYQDTHDAEYYALRHAAGLIDVSPLFKYQVCGADAAAFLSRVTVGDITRLRPGRVTYTCWCDDDGKVIDDGTIVCLATDRFIVTAAEPSWHWFHQFTRGFDVDLVDCTESMAALSLQGPFSRAILNLALKEPIDKLRFFRHCTGEMNGVRVRISRTGYTGDLGYEIWCEADNGVAVWDAIATAGASHGMLPVGLDAMDMTRIEAGFVMNGVDYFSANHCLIERRKSSPFELGLGWTVKLNRAPFVGQQALLAEANHPSPWTFCGLVMDWAAYADLCDGYGLPPHVCSAAWRDGIPLYDDSNNQIGYATSGTWSPLLKQNLALATLQREHARAGQTVMMEATVEYTRHRVPALVVDTPFYDPPRKRS